MTGGNKQKPTSDCGDRTTLTSGEGLSLARWGGRHVVHSSGAVGGAHCGLAHIWGVGLHHQLPLLVSADAHSIANPQPLHLCTSKQAHMMHPVCRGATFDMPSECTELCRHTCT